MRKSLIGVKFKQDVIVDYINAKSKLPRQDNVLNHYHDYYEIYFYLGNHMHYFIKDKPHEVEQNDVVLIDRFLIHRSLYKSDQQHHRILILFNPKLLMKPGRESLKQSIEELFSHQKLTFTNDRKLGRSLEKAMCMYEIFLEPPSAQQDEQLEAELIAFLYYMVGLKKDECLFNHEIEALDGIEQLVGKTIAYINKNYKQKLTLESIAEELYVSKYYLSRTFNTVTKMSISDYWNTRRLSEAERLIRYSNMSLTQISREVGFSSNSYFIKLFKKEYGCTPQAFRSALRE